MNYPTEIRSISCRTVSIIHIKIYGIPNNRGRRSVPKILQKVKEQHHLSTDIVQTFADNSLYESAKKQSSIKFCALLFKLHLPQIFCHRHTDAQKDRHFPKIIIQCLRHPKTCKSMKNRKSKICTKPILSSTYIEESKKRGQNLFLNYPTHFFVL